MIFSKQKAYAKVNLFLKVLGKSSDGYHDIISLVDIISLHDEIEFSFEKSNRKKIEVEFFPKRSYKNNTVERAASLFFDETSFRGKLSVKVRKNIPEGAGLGGGSSDAAETLKFLAKIFRVERKTLEKIGKKVGMDVNLFLFNSPSIIYGKGEMVHPVKIKSERFYVILYPGIKSETAKVYREYDRICGEDAPVPLCVFFSDYTLKEVLSVAGFNDLEEPFINLYHPQIQGIDNGFWVTGSGSCFVRLFENRADAERIYKRLKDKSNKKCKIFMANSVFSKNWNRLYR